MTYPLISEYVAAIQNAADNLDKLSELKPVMERHGEPVHSSGAFAVVFKMVDENGKYFALKCFTEEQTGRDEAYRLITEELDGVESKYLTSVRYYEKELFVDSNVSDETEFPVLLMDWIEGETMDVYISENYQDNSAMEWLCYRFCKMASWLRSQSFAHGDVKPDNIIVNEDGELTLIDYDGMFVPAMKGWKSPTLGTKDFVHPNRKIEDFDETIDDFTLASIALSLKAISLDSSLYDRFSAADRLLFSAKDYLNLSESQAVSELQSLMNNIELMKLESLFKYSLAMGNLAYISFRSFYAAKPHKVKQYTQSKQYNTRRNKVWTFRDFAKEYGNPKFARCIDKRTEKEFYCVAFYKSDSNYIFCFFDHTTIGMNAKDISQQKDKLIITMDADGNYILSKCK